MYRLSLKMLIASVLSLFSWASLPAWAQPSTPIVQWELHIMQEGRQVASLAGQTPLGQSHTETNRYLVSPALGCDQATIELSRTIIITPDTLTDQAVTFALETRETLEKPSASALLNCASPASPRIVNASHPRLVVPFNAWATWQILPRNPMLVYRLRARLSHS
ncbi:hypothetical protein KMZ15_08415 [Mycoavidus sp. HKI]|uniref:hypothetical protein n=1 Tax=Mycoavidus sp. HKI TaxID=2840467 RepID=UPI001CBC057F|nr:hypothetical protein [Mycoavidus sp. HKI]UAW64053.1 hypothetical protein KMZ15_08415 [Mycoavidus sp. HKI]